MALLKLLFCIALAWGSLATFAVVKGKSYETRALRTIVLSAIPLRLITCLAVYIFLPDLNQDSDTIQHYFPRTVDFLNGLMPYVDFKTVYSPLFYVLLALPVFIWKSVGAVVLTMNLLEIATLIVYLKRCKRRDVNYGWRVAFLYYLSPISVYWIGLVGYNGAIIALFTMVALVLAERNRDYVSGLAGAIGYLCSKLLAVLSWPAIVFFYKTGWVKRLIPPAVALLAMLVLTVYGVPVYQTLRGDFGDYTSNNLPFLISSLITGLQNNAYWHLFPLITFFPIMLYLLYLRIRLVNDEKNSNFDIAVALAVAANLLFLIVSRKTFTMYMPMITIFVIHMLLAGDKDSLKQLIPIAILGSLTTIEPYLQIITNVQYEPYSAFEGKFTLLILTSVVIVACNIYLFWRAAALIKSGAHSKT